MKFIAAIFVSLILATSCSQGEPDQAADNGDASAISLRQANSKAAIKKWNSYVDLGNSLDISFSQAINAYFDAFGNGPDYQPSSDPTAIGRFISSLTAPEQLAKAIDQASKMSKEGEKNDLDEAVGEVASHLKELWPALIKSGARHAAVGQPMPDDEEVTDLHSKIHTSYHGVAGIYERFRELLNRADAERRKVDMQIMVDRGLIIRPAMLGLLDSAQAMQDYLSSHSITSETIRSLDMEIFGPLYDEYMLSVKAYEKVAVDAGQPAKEGLKPPVIDNFNKLVKNVTASTFALVEQYNARTAPPANALLTKGTPEHFAYVLGELVDLYNTALNQ